MQLVQNLSQRHGVSTDAVTHMLSAVQNGNGSMAQFSHPEFGGSGQWMSGGMTMVSDLFNNHLKCLVNNLCSDISNALANHQTTPFSGSFQSQNQNGMHAQSQAAGQIGSGNSLFVPDPQANWWPRELGTPSAIGSQNTVRYAYFANIHRLAVTTGGTAIESEKRRRHDCHARTARRFNGEGLHYQRRIRRQKERAPESHLAPRRARHQNTRAKMYGIPSYSDHRVA